ncbi:sugar phosphate isomerase/epimerase [Halosimplex litoreum]|uniref:Sugar phosphate isomerase/epimerase n=1 Tax=Halosimplex litoreum TaxID=1198301 RepID=A0A7T3FWL6_9EURY|nr:TIM barrel protein [Halosimplex litoreum]QPV61852.1 sugar phosphate isomerase/epimerase [Halosimplex litoreum]
MSDVPDWDTFAMDTAFRNSLGATPLAARCEMLADIGYDATYLTLFHERDRADADRVAAVAADHGLDVTAVYDTLDASAPPDDPDTERLLDLADRTDCDLELAVDASDFDASDPAGDDDAVERVERLLDAAGDDVTVSLYPHLGNWLERVGDAVRLCERVDRSTLGVVFPAYHWYAVRGRNRDGPGLRPTLDRAALHLTSVNLCGSRWPPGAGAPTIEPLDAGELDNFAVLGALAAVGYDGPVGIQGYGDGGDAYAKLARSREALAAMRERLVAHPEWADLDRDRAIGP